MSSSCLGLAAVAGGAELARSHNRVEICFSRKYKKNLLLEHRCDGPQSPEGCKVTKHGTVHVRNVVRQNVLRSVRYVPQKWYDICRVCCLVAGANGETMQTFATSHTSATTVRRRKLWKVSSNVVGDSWLTAAANSGSKWASDAGRGLRCTTTTKSSTFTVWSAKRRVPAGSERS